MDWFRYVQGVLNLVGAESHLIGQNEIKALHPLMEVHDIRLGI